VDKDETVVALESEKATVELPAPAAGKVSKILKQKGQTAAIGEVIGYLEEGEAKETPTKEIAPSREAPPSKGNGRPTPPEKETKRFVMPAAERELASRQMEPEEVQATGPGGRLLKEYVIREAGSAQAKTTEAKPPPPKSAPLAER